MHRTFTGQHAEGAPRTQQRSGTESSQSCTTHHHALKNACVCPAVTRRTKHLHHYFFSKCSDAPQAVAVMQSLEASLLTAEEGKMSCHTKIMTIDCHLGKMLPSIQQASRTDQEGTTPNALEIAQKLSAGVSLLAHAGSSARGSNQGESDGSLALHASAIQEAINDEAFKNCEDACAELDTNTAEGRREILEQGLLANCALITKVILRASKELARRHPLLALMLEARGGQGISGLVDYFSHAHALDPITGEIPQRRRKFSVAGEAGTNEQEIRKFIQCKYIDMDWFCCATGIYALRMCDTGAKLTPLPKLDHFTVIPELEELVEFGNVRLTAVGFPTAPETGEGYTWETWWAYYIAHLKLAKRATNRQEQLAWMQQTDVQGRAALRMMGETMERFIHSSSPATAKLGYVLPKDCPPALILKSREAALANLQEHRDLYNWLGSTNHNHHGNVTTDTLPRLSTPAAQRTLDSQAPLSQRQKLDAKGRAAAGANSARSKWLSNNRKLLSAGYVWDAVALRAAYPHLCVEYAASERPPHEAQKECTKQFHTGHAHPGDIAHTLPLTHHELRRRFAKPYDPNHTVNPTVATPNPAPKQTSGNAGRGGGRGGRGSASKPTAKTARGRGQTQGRGGRGQATPKPTPPAARGGNTHHHPKDIIPTPAADAHELTPRHELHPYLQIAAAQLEPMGIGLIDCNWDKKDAKTRPERSNTWKGEGTCIDNAAAFLLAKLNQPYSAQVLRYSLVLRSRSEEFLNKCTENGITYAEVIINSLQSWPKQELAKALALVEADPPNATKRQAQERLLGAWRKAMLNRDTYGDEAELWLLADAFALEILAYVTVDGNLGAPRRFTPAKGKLATARIILVIVANIHAVAGALIKENNTLRLRHDTHPNSGTQSTHAKCPHGWVLLKGTLDKNIPHRCSRTECHAKSRQMLTRTKQYTYTGILNSLEIGEHPLHGCRGYHWGGKPGSLSVGCPCGAFIRLVGERDARAKYCNKVECRDNALNQWAKDKSSIQQHALSSNDNNFRRLSAMVSTQSAHAADHYFDQKRYNMAYDLDPEPPYLMLHTTDKAHHPNADQRSFVTAKELYDARNDKTALKQVQDLIKKFGITPAYLESEKAQCEFCAISFPIRSREDLEKLLACEVIAPNELIGFEFSAAMRTCREKAGAIPLSCDLRDTDIFGMHAQMDIRHLLNIKQWNRAYHFPPCYQQLRADGCLQNKALDGRAMWGILMCIRCAYSSASLIIFEQPDSLVKDMTADFNFNVLELRSSSVGDCWPDKFVRLTLIRAEIDRSLLPDKIDTRRPGVDYRTHYSLYDTQNDRDRDKSTFAHFPNLCQLLSSATYKESPPLYPETYTQAAELFAYNWYRRGYPVMAGYLDPDANPPPEHREYQPTRGPGDYRRPPTVIPTLALQLSSPRRVEPAMQDASAGSADTPMPEATAITARAGGYAECKITKNARAAHLKELWIKSELLQKKLRDSITRGILNLHSGEDADVVIIINAMERIQAIDNKIESKAAQLHPHPRGAAQSPTAFDGLCRAGGKGEHGYNKYHRSLGDYEYRTTGLTAPGTIVARMERPYLTTREELKRTKIPHVRIEDRPDLAVQDLLRTSNNALVWESFPHSNDPNVIPVILGDNLIWIAVRFIPPNHTITRNVLADAISGDPAISLISNFATEYHAYHRRPPPPIARYDLQPPCTTALPRQHTTYVGLRTPYTNTVPLQHKTYAEAVQQTTLPKQKTRATQKDRHYNKANRVAHPAPEPATDHVLSHRISHVVRAASGKSGGGGAQDSMYKAFKRQTTRNHYNKPQRADLNTDWRTATKRTRPRGAHESDTPRAPAPNAKHKEKIKRQRAFLQSIIEQQRKLNELRKNVTSATPPARAGGNQQVSPSQSYANRDNRNHNNIDTQGTAPPCATPFCSQPRTYPSRYCSPHHELLHKEIEDIEHLQKTCALRGCTRKCCVNHCTLKAEDTCCMRHKQALHASAPTPTPKPLAPVDAESTHREQEIEHFTTITERRRRLNNSPTTLLYAHETLSPKVPDEHYDGTVEINWATHSQILRHLKGGDARRTKPDRPLSSKKRERPATQKSRDVHAQRNSTCSRQSRTSARASGNHTRGRRAPYDNNEQQENDLEPLEIERFLNNILATPTDFTTQPPDTTDSTAPLLPHPIPITDLLTESDWAVAFAPLEASGSPADLDGRKFLQHIYGGARTKRPRSPYRSGSTQEDTRTTCPRTTGDTPPPAPPEQPPARPDVRIRFYPQYDDTAPSSPHDPTTEAPSDPTTPQNSNCQETEQEPEPPRQLPQRSYSPESPALLPEQEYWHVRAPICLDESATAAQHDELARRPHMPMPAVKTHEHDQPELDEPLHSLQQRLLRARRTIRDVNWQPGQCGPDALSEGLRRLGWNVSSQEVRRQVARAAVRLDVADLTISIDGSNTSLGDLISESHSTWRYAGYDLSRINNEINERYDLSPSEKAKLRTLRIIDLWAEQMLDATTHIDPPFLIIATMIYQIELHIVAINENGEGACPVTCIPPPGQAVPAQARIELACVLDTHFALILSTDIDSGIEDESNDAPQSTASLASDTNDNNIDEQHAQSQQDSEKQATDTEPYDSAKDDYSESSAQYSTTQRRPPSINIARASRNAVMLMLIAAGSAAQWARPLVLVHTNGMEIIGYDMPSLLSRSACLNAAQAWARLVAGESTIASLVGEFSGGARLCAAPVAEPISAHTCTTPAERCSLLQAGIHYSWCTLSALMDTPSYDVATRAVIAIQSFITPLKMLSYYIDNEGFHTGAQAPRPVDPNDDSPYLGIEDSARAIEATRLHDNTLVRTLDNMNSDGTLDGWADIITPISTQEIPDSLLNRLPSYRDNLLDTIPLAPVQDPITSNWIPLPPQQEPPPPDTPACVTSVLDMMSDETKFRYGRWLNQSRDDMLSVYKQSVTGTAPHTFARNRPQPIAIGQSELKPWARNRVWDCRMKQTHCCIIANFHAQPESNLNLNLIERRLRGYPDQALMSHLLEGVRLEADVERQTVLVPHLVSLSQGFTSVTKELLRMHSLNWYEFYEHTPFWPLYINGQGSTPRKLEPDRYRRTTEGGGPRKETRDKDGVIALSLNYASRIYHMPLHYLQDTRDSLRDWLAARGLPRPQNEPSNPATSKWPRERKPLLAEAMRDLAILRRAAEVLNLPIYVFSDDAADFFSQLAMSAPDIPLLGIYYLDPTSITQQLLHPKPIFIVEKRLGFGMHGASNVAQRFSDALLHLFRQDMDEAESGHLSGDSPAEKYWYAAREKACERSAAPKRSPSTSEASSCHEHRLYSARMYTDDALFICVGAERTARAIKIWKQLTDSIGLRMAKKEKRHLGSHALWLGVLILAPLGICVIPKLKLLRAAHSIQRAIDNHLCFAEYRSLCGLLEHLRAVCLLGRNVMFGLYEPHAPTGASAAGPDARVHCSILMKKQLQRWKHNLAAAAGVHARQTIMRLETHPAPEITIALCSDACLGDTDEPGIGGFCHGMYWYLRIPNEHIPLVNIPLLEFLGVCGNILIFYPYLRGFANDKHTILLRTDALTTALTLPRQRQQAPPMMRAFLRLASTPEYKHLKKHLQISHIWGDANPLSDRISRGKWKEFHQLCSQLRVQPVQLNITANFRTLYLNTIINASVLPHLRGGCRQSLRQRLQQGKAGVPKPSASNKTDSSLHRPLSASTISLHSASCQVAQSKAAAIANGGEDSMQLKAPFSRIAAATSTASLLATKGINKGTARKDERAWELWLKVCRHFKTAPIRTAEDIRNDPERIAFLLTSLMVYARMYCTPSRPGCNVIKPNSCLAYPLAIIRIYKRWGMVLPGWSQLKACLQGMCVSYIAHHGPNSITPHKAEPMQFKMVKRLYDLPTQAHDDAHTVFIFKRACVFAMNSGARLAAIAQDREPTSDKKIEDRTWLVRADVTWNINGTVIIDPDRAQLDSLKPGDSILIRPPRAKCDQWLEVHAHFPWNFTLDDSRYNVVKAIRDIELTCPCRGDDRARTALFASLKGEPLPHSVYSTLLRNHLTQIYGCNVAKLYTWHSFRSGLATALHAAGIADETIMSICHWVSPESLRSYRRLSRHEYAAALAAAEAVPVSLLQPRNAPTVSGDQHYAALLSGFNNLSDPINPNSTRTTPSSTHPTPTRTEKPTATRNKQPTFINWEPLSQQPRVGDKVLVKREVWPSYTCDEQEGKGWEAHVLSASSKTALIRFCHAKTARGRKYADTRVPLQCLLTPHDPTPPVRAGCRSTYEPPKPGQPNSIGYPQLVPSDTCALCKRPLPPLTAAPAETANVFITQSASLESLQCERCGRVRYCSEECAHLHYWACHRHMCPLPDFSKTLNAEYVSRRGTKTHTIPIRCVNANPSSFNPLHTPTGAQAKCRAWTTVPHKGSRTSCKWCTEPVSSHTTLRHDTWFTALITRIRGTDEPQWTREPRWRGPIAIYSSHPSSQTHWPDAHPHARFK